MENAPWFGFKGPLFTCYVCCAREAVGIDQKQLADLLGIARDNLRLIEQGKRAPNVIMAQAIATTVGRTVEELFVPHEFSAYVGLSKQQLKLKLVAR